MTLGKGLIHVKSMQILDDQMEQFFPQKYVLIWFNPTIIWARTEEI